MVLQFFLSLFLLLLHNMHTIEKEAWVGGSPQTQSCHHYCDSVSLLRLSEMTAMCCQKSDPFKSYYRGIKDLPQGQLASMGTHQA